VKEFEAHKRVADLPKAEAIASATHEYSKTEAKLREVRAILAQVHHLSSADGTVPQDLAKLQGRSKPGSAARADSDEHNADILQPQVDCSKGSSEEVVSQMVNGKDVLSRTMTLHLGGQEFQGWNHVPVVFGAILSGGASRRFTTACPFDWTASGQ